MKQAFYAVIGLLFIFSLSAAGGAHASIPATEWLENAHTNAVELLKKNEYEKVIQLESEVIEKDPRDLTAYFLLSIAYLGADDEKKALEQAEIVKQIDSMFASEIYGSMGRFFITKKRYHKALHYFKEALKITEDPEVIRHVATIYLGQGLLDKARMYYEKLLLSKPDYVALGRICLAQGDYGCALKYGQSAVKADFKGPSGYLLLGTVYLLTGNNELSKANFHVLRELSPEFFLTSYFIGLIKMTEEDYDGALVEFGRTLAGSPNFIDGYLMSAAAWHIKGNHSLAVEFVKKAIELDPLDTMGRLVLANVYISEKEFAKADEEYRKAVDIFPDAGMPEFVASEQFKGKEKQLPAYLNLAALYHRAGLYRQSAHVLSRRQSSEFRNAFTLVTAARSELKLGNKKAAEELFSAALKDNQMLITPYVELGGLYESEGDQNEAVKYFTKASRLAPNIANLKVKLGEVYAKINDTRSAEDNYRKALAIAPDSVVTYNKLALLLSNNRETSEDALKYALKGSSLNPEDTDIKDTLGWIYFKLGRYEDALSAYNAIIGRDLSNPVVHYHIGMVYLHLGRTDEAVAAFEKALNIKDEFTGAEEAKRNLRRLSGIG